MDSLAFVDETHLKDLGIPLGPRLSILGKAKCGAPNGVAHTKTASGCRNGGHSADEEDWETCSSSNSSDEDEDDESGPALQAKRLARFYGPHEWKPSFVIDFADCKTGDPLYDLVAIFFAALVSAFIFVLLVAVDSFWCCVCRIAIANCGRRLWIRSIGAHTSRESSKLTGRRSCASASSSWCSFIQVGR